MSERHIHQEVDFVCVLCGADLTPAIDAPPALGLVIAEETTVDEKIS